MKHEIWESAMTVARQYDISPWEALLLSVKLAAGRVAWVDQQLRAVVLANDGDMNAPAVRGWLKESRNERRLLAQTAKGAIDAGVQERLVRQVELEGQLMADVLVRVLDTLGLDVETRTRALATAQRELLALGTSEERVVLALPPDDPHPER